MIFLQSINKKFQPWYFSISAAFDTIDHKILLSRLSSFYGLSNTALNLIASYLLDRTQSVSIQLHSTPPSAISQVYHRVLSLALFSFHCTQALSVKSLQRLQFHIIYMLTTHKFTFHFHPTSLMTVSPCSPPLDEAYAWLTSNRLSVNPSKTEFLIVGNPQQRNKIQSSSIVFCGNIISPSSSARNLGVTLIVACHWLNTSLQYADLLITK